MARFTSRCVVLIYSCTFVGVIIFVCTQGQWTGRTGTLRIRLLSSRLDRKKLVMIGYG